ncbi:PREDICTED: polycystic kidney disease protein 1-like 2 [Branchiostoma belcheri]|uniref:Polycystic kidney disease protein 1-like 2 n=1 Tax=Branchiostoma belcheri TaxID=7741 RepID=A0A6P4YPC4_BRABE|nr:PREDICTED: polycystic kidney disease protein 1-like 2 [Branchiostoma belcheri]
MSSETDVQYSPVLEIPPGYVVITPRVFSIDGRETILQLPPVQILPPTLEQLAQAVEELYNRETGLFFIHQQQGAKEQAFMDSVIPPKALASLANQGSDIKESKAATTLAFQALDLLTDVILNATMSEVTDVDVFAVYNTSKVHVRIQRQNKSDSEEKVYLVEGISDSLVRIPSVASLVGDKCTMEDTVVIQFFEANFNPFEYSENSYGIQSDVVGLHVRCGDKKISVSDLEEPIDILTRREDEGGLDNMTYIFSDSAELGNLSVFRFYAKKEFSSFGFSLDVSTENSSVSWQSATLYLNKHEPPTTDTYGWSGSLPLPDDELFTLPSLNMTSNPHQWHVGLLSNTTHIHCRCNHLTKFAGFVSPNPLNIEEVLNLGLVALSENPVGLALVLAVFASYLFGLLCVRKADRKDLTKVGLWLLPGHRLNPRKDCQYVVTVYTGLRGNAGTTADISISLYGFTEYSPAIVLKDSQRFLFERGSVDSFLVSIEQPVGPLTHLRVWHNNAGYSPAWFLSQVVIVNRGTNETTYFLANRWFGVDEEDGQIDRMIPSAPPEELAKFRNVFWAKSYRDMSDDHMWFSVALRPARSPFTRVQRLSCCLTLLYCTMFTNIMFFGRGDDFDPPEPIRLAGVEIKPPISLPQLMIGVQSALIILPVNLLIALFFRYSGRNTKTATNDEKTKPQSADVPVLESSKLDGSFGSNTPSYWCPTNRPAVGMAVRDKHVAACGTQSSGTTHLDRSPGNDENERPGSAKKFSLPSWCVFLGWLLVWSASFVAAFFTILYSLSFGPAKAEAWAVTFLTSFFTDMLLIQPVKLVLVAVVFALLFRKPVEDENPPASPLADDEEFLQNDAESPGHETPASPPDESTLEEVRARSAEKRKRRNAVLEVLVFGLFFAAIMLVAYGERSPLAFHMTQNVRENIMGGQDDIPDIKDIPSFWEWVTDGLIPATHSEELYNGEATYGDMVLPDMLTHPLGRTQLRQVRLVPGPLCQTAEQLRTLLPRCNTGYSHLNADTGDYIEGWIPQNDTSNFNDTSNSTEPTTCPSHWNITLDMPGVGECLTGNSTWKYTFASVSDSFPHVAKHGTYLSEGGYSTTFGTEPEASQAAATFLQQHNWLDERTRAVFVELILYNPHANLFSVVTIVVEFTPLGAAFTSGEVVTLRLIQRDALLLLAFRVLMGMFLVFFTAKEGENFVYSVILAKKIHSRPIQYLGEFWSWVELLVIFIGFSTLGVYLKAQFIIDETAEQRASPVFELYRSAANWYGVYTYLLGFLICCVTLKFIQLLRFNSHVLSLTMTLKKSFKPVMQFCVIAGIVLMAFTLMGNLLFGTKIQGYKNILSSLGSLCTMMLGSFDFDAIVEGHTMLGPLMFFSYQFMMQFVLLSMFMTIIMDVYTEEGLDPKTENLQIVNFIRDTTSVAVGNAGCTIVTVGKRTMDRTNAEVQTPDPNKNQGKIACMLWELNDPHRI